MMNTDMPQITNQAGTETWGSETASKDKHLFNLILFNQ